MLRLIFVFLLLISPPAFAADYNIDYDQSALTFSGTHAGNTFEGRFNEWSAQISFNPDDLENSSLSATFKTASAETGDKMYDGTLPQADWFDSANHPEAVFKSTSITENDANGYTAAGDLTIRGITRPLTFDFTLSDVSAEPVTATAQFPIDRLAYEIGKKSDPEAEWVSKDITIDLKITAYSE